MERTKAGLAAARSRGKKGGRATALIKRAKAMLADFDHNCRRGGSAARGAAVDALPAYTGRRSPPSQTA